MDPPIAPIPRMLTPHGMQVIFLAVFGGIFFILLWMYYMRKRAHFYSAAAYRVELTRDEPRPSVAVPTPPEARRNARRDLDRIRAFDPSFSAVAFEDFVRARFVEAHRAGALDLRIGDIRYLSVDGVAGDTAAFLVAMDVEASCLETSSGESHRVYLAERWAFRRSRTDDARVWVVDSVDVRSRRTEAPPVTIQEPESGGPAVVFPGAPAKLRELAARDPHVTWPALQARVEFLFREVQEARGAREPERARPWLTDGLFERERYWAEVYERQKLRRVRRDAAVTSLVLCRVASDEHYDLITARVYAVGTVYTVDDAGGLVTGDRKARKWSEYWTLLRRAGRSAPIRADNVCPSCGGPLQTGPSGECSTCHARLPAGDFDWVLDRIERDISGA
jgi:hypothetical protein